MDKIILVVDDDDMNLKMSELILKKKNYKVIKANSGQAALDCLSDEPVDIVLLDVEMPGMSGIETLEKIRERSELAELPVLFLSASEEMEQEVANGKYPVQGFIKKPFIPQKLYDSLAAL